VFVKDHLGQLVEYEDCRTTQTICEISLQDLIADYSLVEDDTIHVQVQSENVYGLSELTDFVEEEAKAIQTVPHKPTQSPIRGALTSQT
jgi:hypothetical protein